MSSFDPQTFAQMTFSGSLSTKSIPVPAEEWQATLKKYEIKEWSNREKTEGGLKAVFLWNVTDPQCVEVTGQENNYVRDEIFLQLTDDGKLDLSKGKNIALGKRLEAVGLNKGDSWSFDMMLERQAVIRVKHRIDSRDNETKYAEVAAIAPL